MFLVMKKLWEHNCCKVFQTHFPENGGACILSGKQQKLATLLLFGTLSPWDDPYELLSIELCICL